MLNLKKKKLVKSKLLVSSLKKRKSKLKIMQHLNEVKLIAQLNQQKTQFRSGLKQNVNIKKPPLQLVSRVKKRETVNLTAKTKSGFNKMSFKQVEQKFIGHIMRKGLRAKALAI
jgi:hypothetical protein